MAELHSKNSKLKIRYLNKSPEQLKEFEKFDIILNLEIVEHVANVDLYIDSCQKLLKKWINVLPQSTDLFHPT